MIIQFDRARILFIAVHATGNPIHIFPADGTDLLQQIYHTVYRCRTDRSVYGCRFIIDFFATGAFLPQNYVKQNLSLLGNSAAFFSQFLNDQFFLHLGSVKVCNIPVLSVIIFQIPGHRSLLLVAVASALTAVTAALQ